MGCSSLFTINGSIKFKKKNRKKENINLTKSTIYNNDRNVYRQCLKIEGQRNPILEYSEMTNRLTK